VWSTRISNAAGDAALSTGGKAFSIGLSLTFVAFALAGAVVLVRSWSRPRTNGERTLLKGFSAWTIVVWVIRVPMIALADHVAGFKIVHAMLGIISIGLAAWVWRSTREPATDTARATDQESVSPTAQG
jgi:Na+/melibiose symporter-like transporter